MDKVCVLLLVCLFVISNGNGNGDDDEQRKISSLWEWERLRSAYSAYWALFPSNIGQCCWNMLKELVNHGYGYGRFFPPNIDFRRGAEGKGVTETENGSGEKAREALARSVGTSKASMSIHDAAKSSANTNTNTETEHQNEL